MFFISLSFERGFFAGFLGLSRYNDKPMKFMTSGCFAPGNKGLAALSNLTIPTRNFLYYFLHAYLEGGFFFCADCNSTHQSFIFQLHSNILYVISVDVVIINWYESLENCLRSHPGGNFQPAVQKRERKLVSFICQDMYLNYQWQILFLCTKLLDQANN